MAAVTLETAVRRWRSVFRERRYDVGRVGNGRAASNAPAIYVLSALIGAVLVAVCFAAYGWAQEKISRAEVIKVNCIPPRSANSLQTVFQDQRIFLDDFRHPIDFPHYKEKRFINCAIFGPAILIFGNYNNVDPLDCIGAGFVMVTPPKEINNGIQFSNCQFLGCRFIKVTFYIDTKMRERLDKMAATPIQWLN